MRIQALYNQDGIIVAAASIDGDYDGPIPVSSEGAESGTFDVPEDMAERPLDEICTSLRVDVTNRRLIAAKRD